MSSFLVTGGAGFIGSHLVHKLIESGHRVRVLDNLSTGRLENLRDVEGQFEWRLEDAADEKKIGEAMAGIDGVFHLAAIPSVPLSIDRPSENQRSGEVAIVNILDAARRANVKRVVYSSSCAVYGDCGAKRISEEAIPQPLTFYGLSKITSESYCRMFSNFYPPLETVSLRYFNVYGHRQNPKSSYAGVIGIFLRCLRGGTQPIIYGTGEQRRDFIHVSDVVNANMLAMESRNTFRGEAFNVGTGTDVSILELWTCLAEIAKSDAQPQFASERTGDIRNSCAEITRIRKGLGFEPKVTLRDGLTELWAHPEHD